MNKLWRIRGKEGKYTDEELIALIKRGELKGEDYIANSELKKWMRIQNTIYQFYLGGLQNETL